MSTVSHLGSRLRQAIGSRRSQQQLDEPQPPVPILNPPTLPHSIASSPTTHSASSLARGPEFRWVQAEASCNFHFMNVVMPIEILDTFYDEIKYPHFVKDDNFITLITEHERKMVEQISYRPFLPFRGWAQSLQDNQLESNDQYKIQNWSSALFAFWNSTLSARALQGNEAEIRRGVDLMVQLAFQLRLEAVHIVRMEKDLPLPGSPGKAIADLIAMMKLPLDWIKFLSPLKNQHVFNAGLQPGNVITFLYEAKCNDDTTASHQLSFYLCSAQHQRRAIGFTDGQLFGAILNGSILKIYASWWEHNTVMIYPTQYQLPLGTFPEFLTCYIFLCKLANHIAHGVDAVFQDWNNNAGQRQMIQQRAHEASDNPWYHQRSQTPRSPHKRVHYDDGVGGSGAQDEDDLESSMMDDRESSGQGPSDTHMAFDTMSKSQGDLLTQANLQALGHANLGVVQGWAQHLAGANVDTSVL